MYCWNRGDSDINLLTRNQDHCSTVLWQAFLGNIEPRHYFDAVHNRHMNLPWQGSHLVQNTVNSVANDC